MIRSRPTLALLAVLCVAALPGCQFAAWFLQVAFPVIVEAEYDMPDHRTAVFIDDPRNILPSEQVEVEVGDRILKDLVAEGVLSEGNTIPTREVSALETNHKDFQSWTIQKVGQELGVDQLIYVFVDTFDLGETQEQFRPSAATRIKVYDVQANTRVYPAGGGVDYRRINTRLAFVGPQHLSTQAVRQTVTAGLSQDLARDIARLFYRHEDTYSGFGESRNPVKQ